ncbi:uncharacterized protein L3040_006241 [Drepanopeziza brunnea f. sp. 'multigermtubi']|uniref:Protein kinase domain-containing protein n=1 Tax=Marssonina brunnea f. sp. multigermtubi (strain MB_m1) TaxID=1072389 RepID=K1WV73_MARBU|nr:uncharacterized protein MBM_04533 [Drepanopeziza brunnea f. sp. 'multigermtubi' MB_m1]EKD16956.1 hypothetical protein MBM_04533 [Drepanopeziza brunnea f. sp. 'multigermtubi' MB_m1]KAJ5040589.1 hypothetical protein L3040_006241 [Drepanopeziza brunnea f. sp. 'multigermtubi']
MESLPYRGSTSSFYRFDSGTVLKSPMKVWEGNPNRERLQAENEVAIRFEGQILYKLGSHPRIVPFVDPPNLHSRGLSNNRYLGPHTPSGGILLSQASHGTLQAYLDSNNTAIDKSLRWKWSVQAVEAVAHVHSQGVIHSDLKPENYLVHATADGSSLDLWLCDFGGSTCRELGHSIPHLPDDPFFDVRMPWIPTEAIDIFSLGSIIYTILTGHWPYREGTPPLKLDDIGFYETYVNEMITKGVFPDVSSLRAGKVIRGCWDHQYQTTKEVLEAMRLELAALDKEDV